MIKLNDLPVEWVEVPKDKYDVGNTLELYIGKIDICSAGEVHTLELEKRFHASSFRKVDSTFSTLDEAKSKCLEYAEQFINDLQTKR